MRKYTTLRITTITTAATSRAAADQRDGRRRQGPRWRRGLRALLLLWAVAAAGCDAGPGPEPAPPTDLAVEIGGALPQGDGWVSWGDGKATPAITRGPQGGQHIWVRVRTRGLWPAKQRLDVTMTLLDTGVVVRPGTVPILQSSQAEPDGSALSTAITAYVTCPCQVVGRRLRIHAAVVDLYGLAAEGSAEVTPTWDGDCSQKPVGNCTLQ